MARNRENRSSLYIPPHVINFAFFDEGNGMLSIVSLFLLCL